MRFVSITALFVAAALVLIATVIAQADRNHLRGDRTRSLTGSSEEYAGAVAAMMRQTQLSVLLSSDDPSFRGLLIRSARRRDSGATAVRDEALRALANLQRLVPSVDEAGVLDAEGRDLLRVRGGKRLSGGTRNSSMFFTQAMITLPGRAYQSVTYRAPGADERMIAYAVPMDYGQRRLGVVYAQTPVASLRRLVERNDSIRLRLVDMSTGVVIVDTATDMRAAARRLQLTLPQTLADRPGGVIEQSSPVAFRWLSTPEGSGNQRINPKQWLVLATSTASTAGWLGAFAGWPLGLLGIASVLGCGGLIVLHVSRRRLDLAANRDVLTCIPNRRALMGDLERIQEHGDPVRLAMFDLNGFKEYNDTFGHLAGDALLQRVALALLEAVRPARAYRLGGDEFCLVSPLEKADELEALAAVALTERGPGFVVNASWGSVAFPLEASNVSDALAIADERMYRHKRGGRSGALAQTKATLLTLMAERDPALAAHHERVAGLAERTAIELQLPVEIIPHLKNAAELHDVGMLAIPEAILNKTDPLDEAEQEFVHRHAVIGERILNSAESLQTAAAIVRATHERWDGAGYPAQMGGDAIPLAARIIFVCDAYDVMTHDQPYRPAMSDTAAREELSKGAGKQFDARVIAALEQILNEGTTAAAVRMSESSTA